MKETQTASIQVDMANLSFNVLIRLVAATALALGCSSKVEIAQDNTGGNSSQTGGTSTQDSHSTSSTTTGGSESFGGAPPTGGNESFGGAPPTGGNESFGGAPSTGGNESFGGAPPTGGNESFGGAPPTGGNMAYGGTPPTGGNQPIMATGGNQPIDTQPHLPGICTPGVDLSCNGLTMVSSVMGHCEQDGSCTCGGNWILDLRTGRCTSYEETVCYSPKQNIDLAYVSRAFGCSCQVGVTPPYCGIDSKGLRVYLECRNSSWQSGDTSHCNGGDPDTCYSPSNTTHALDANAIGCSCSGSATCVKTAATGGLDAGPTADASVSELYLRCENSRWQRAEEASCKSIF